MGSCAAPSAKGDDKFITTDYLQQCLQHFVAVQLNIRRPEVLSRYAERDTTLREHTALIKEYYGYHEFGDFPWSFRLKRLLYTRAWLSNERPGLMFDFATAWLLQNKVLLPGATTLVGVPWEFLR